MDLQITFCGFGGRKHRFSTETKRKALKLHKMAKIQLAIVGIAFLITLARAQEELVCRGEDVVFTEKEKGQIGECLKESKIDNVFKIPMEKLPCFGVCLLTKKDMLTDDGKINHEKALKYIEAHMKNKETQKLLVDAADKCIKDHGQDVKVKDDPTCSTFMGVGQCVHDAFFEICFPGKK